MTAIDPLANANQSARGIINAALAQYGLDTLSDWAWQQYTQGSSTDQIMLDLKTRPEYDARFPAMKALAKQGHALTEQQYLDYERQVSQVMRANGIPPGMWDQPDDFQKFLENNLSVSEVQDRVQMASATLNTASPETRAAINRMYDAGASEGDIIAFFADPDRAAPLIAKQYQAAQAAGAGATSGYGQLSRAEAEAVGDRGLTQQQLDQGFGELVQNEEITKERLGAHAPGAGAIDRWKQLGAAFLGDAAAQREIANEAARRKAEFAGGGGFTEDKPGTGFTGIGAQSS